MLRPVLLVGVGGSGGKTLRAMRQSLLRQLKTLPNWDKDDLPAGWQMLWIDSVSDQVEDAFPAPLLPAVQYCGLVAPGASYTNIRTALENSVLPNQRQSTLAGWVPPSVPIAVAAGAGQARAIGRAISAANLAKIKKALDEASARMKGVSVTSELASIASQLGQSSDSSLSEPMAIVISSVAGGSGSGMFLDVVEAVKSVDSVFMEPVNLITVLYTPDVFNSIGQGGGMIPPNALAAVMEAMSGVVSASLSPATDSLLQGAGLTARSRHGFGAKCNFLVGSGNSRVSLGSQEDIYYAVGESLCAVVTDDTVQWALRGYALTNVFLQSGNAMNVLDASLLTDARLDDESMPFAGLGMGRVSVGTDRFGEYAASLIGRDLTEAFLWPDFEPPDPQNPMTTEQRISQRAADRWSAFKTASGLDELDPANDVIDQLVDAWQPGRVAAWSEAGRSKAAAGLDESGMAPTDWTTRLQSYFDNYLAPLREQETTQRYELAKEWTRAIQVRILNLTAEYVVSVGLAVTSDLLQRLIDELSTVVTELQNQADTLRNHVSLVPGRLPQTLNVGGSKLSPQDPAVDEAVRVIRLGAEWTVDSDRHDLAANLLSDLSENLLVPLRNAVQFSRARLSRSVTDQQLPDGRPNPWPVQARYGKPVPTQMLPGTIERVLIDPAKYEATLGEQTRRCLSDSALKDAWRTVLRQRVGLSVPLETGEGDQQLIEIASGWIPTDGRATHSVVGSGGAAGNYQLPRDFGSVIEFASNWLSRVDLSGGLGKYLKQSLVEYLESGSPQEQVDHEEAFLAAFTQAVQVAAPFVDVNSAVRAIVHPGLGDSYDAVVSTIPFPEGEALFPKLKAVLVNNGLWSDAKSPGWFKSGGVDAIEIFTMSGKAMMPMVFDNLMKDVSTSWAVNSSNPALRHSFWKNRRARPLVESIPIDQRRIQQMLRGWFIARLLGQCEVSDDPNLGWKVSIWDDDPSVKSFVAFPYPLLTSETVTKPDIPAVVLKSLAIAMVKVNETGTMTPLRPYWRLLDLGSDERFPGILRNWILQAQVPDRGPTPETALAGDAAGTADERKAKVLDTLQKTRESYEMGFAAIADRDDPFTTSRAWELRGTLLSSLLELIKETDGISEDVGVL